MFLAHNQVRMHDTDVAGILYFPRQFRFAHDALEDFVEKELGLTFDHVFRQEKFVFVIVHAESDYFIALRVGDKLDIELSIETIGTTSFTVHYKIYKKDKSLAGEARTVHVTLDGDTRQKIPIPVRLKHVLEAHLERKAHP